MCRQFLSVLLIGLCFASNARAITPSTTTDTSVTDELPPQSSKEKLLGFFPPSISDGLDFDLWG